LLAAGNIRPIDQGVMAITARIDDRRDEEPRDAAVSNDQREITS
jgi:hypothetical protein